MKEKFQNGEGVSHSQNNTACKQANPKNKIYYRHHISNYCQEKCFRKCVMVAVKFSNWKVRSLLKLSFEGSTKSSFTEKVKNFRSRKLSAA